MQRSDLFIHIISPFELAQEVYDIEECEDDFWTTMVWYMEYGYVVSKPDYFAMFRPVCSTALHSDIVGDACFDADELDCWHFQIVAGDMRQIFDHVPYDLELTSFEKRNRLRFCDKATILRITRNSIFNS